MIWQRFKKLKIKPRYKLMRVRLDYEMPENLHGEYDPETNKVRLNPKFSMDEMHFSYIHEYLHAISEAYNIGLTERQVIKIENALANTYRLNLDFSLDPPKDKPRRK